MANKKEKVKHLITYNEHKHGRKVLEAHEMMFNCHRVRNFSYCGCGRERALPVKGYREV